MWPRRLATAPTPGLKGVFALRPEQIRIGADQSEPTLPNRFAGTVRDLLYVGDVTSYVIDLAAGARIQALMPNSTPGRARFFDPGDAVEVGWRGDAGLFLDE